MQPVLEVKPKELFKNPSTAELRSWAMKKAVPNIYGIPLFHTVIKSRSAKFTDYIYDVDEVKDLLEEVKRYVSQKQLIEINGRIGSDENPFYHRYYVEKDYAYLAFMMRENFFEEWNDSPDLCTLCLPGFPQRKILVFPNHRFTIILGSDYYGESKMAQLRMAMHIMREDRGGLGLHAGSKEFVFTDDNKNLVKKGALIFGLSGTGKTTITCTSWGFEFPNRAGILQDDINMILLNGKGAFGTERNFYVKTDNITGEKLLFYAVLSPNAILENVYVDEKGRIDFDNWSISTNGRAIVRREEIRCTTDHINLEEVNFLFFITRRYDLPPVGYLETPDKAALYFALGESTITSADDPAKEGQPKRVLGFDPFIIPPKGKNVNLLYQFLKNNPSVKCYLLNTGWINGKKIKKEHTFRIVECIVKEKIQWKEHKALGFKIIDTLDPDLQKRGPKTSEERSIYEMDRFIEREFDPDLNYGDEYSEMMHKLWKEREEHLKNYPEILPEILNAKG